jgi:hypothetical protein
VPGFAASGGLSRVINGASPAGYFLKIVECEIPPSLTMHAGFAGSPGMAARLTDVQLARSRQAASARAGRMQHVFPGDEDRTGEIARFNVPVRRNPSPWAIHGRRIIIAQPFYVGSVSLLRRNTAVFSQFILTYLRFLWFYKESSKREVTQIYAGSSRY